MPTRTTAVGLALLAAAGLTLTACSSSTPDPAKVSNAQKLADLDHDKRPASDYQTLLGQLEPKCTQGPDKIAPLVYGTQKVLHDDGVTDETNYSVLVHLNQSLPGGAPATNCEDIAAAYVTLRESGGS